MNSKNIIILANSRRHNGHCIAGKDLTTGQWIRPINILCDGHPRIDQSAFLPSDFEKLIGNPSGPSLLNCVRIGFGRSCPLYYQPENIFIDGNPWVIQPSYSPKNLIELIDNSETCCLQDNDPYYKSIPTEDLIANPPQRSLSLIRLIRKENRIEVEHTIKQGKKPQHRLHFDYPELGLVRDPFTAELFSFLKNIRHLTVNYKYLYSLIL